MILKPGLLRFVLQIKKNQILVMSNLRKVGISTLALTSLAMAADDFSPASSTTTTQSTPASGEIETPTLSKDGLIVCGSKSIRQALLDKPLTVAGAPGKQLDLFACAVSDGFNSAGFAGLFTVNGRTCLLLAYSHEDLATQRNEKALLGILSSIATKAQEPSK